MDDLFDSKTFLKREDIKEHTVYLVEVSWRPGNPMHKAILFIGFKTGAYCDIYSNCYDEVFPLARAYRLKIIKELCLLK